MSGATMPEEEDWPHGRATLDRHLGRNWQCPWLRTWPDRPSADDFGNNPICRALPDDYAVPLPRFRVRQPIKGVSYDFDEEIAGLGLRSLDPQHGRRLRSGSACCACACAGRHYGSPGCWRCDCGWRCHGRPEEAYLEEAYVEEAHEEVQESHVGFRGSWRFLPRLAFPAGAIEFHEARPLPRRERPFFDRKPPRTKAT